MGLCFVSCTATTTRRLRFGALHPSNVARAGGRPSVDRLLFRRQPPALMVPRLSRSAVLLWGVVLGVLVGAPAAAQTPDAAALRARADARAAAGDSLRAERQLGAARAAYRRARTLYRRGEAPAQAAEMEGNVGIAYYLDEQLEAARTAFRTAATEARAAGARGEAASNLNNMGLVEWRRGQYDAALEHIREAVRIQRELGNRKQVASGVNNLANIQEERGRYDAALRNLREALRINRALGDTVDIASNLNNMGLVLRSQGRYEDALRYHRQALERHRAEGADEGVAAALNNTGLVLEVQGRYEEALTHYRQAIEVNRRLDDRSSVATNLHNIAAIRSAQGRHGEALETLKKVLRMNRALGERAGLAANLNGMGEVYADRGAYEEARRFFEKALRLDRELGRRDGIAENLHDLGDLYLTDERYAAADSVLRASIRITESLFRTAAGETRRDFLAQEMRRYQTLVTARARAGRPAAALRTYERSRARLLAERLSGTDSTLTVPPVDSLRTTVGRDEAAVLYANTGTERPILAIVVTRDTVCTREVSTSPLREAAGRYEEALDRLRIQEELPWIERRTSLLRDAKGVEAGSGTEGTLANLVRLYRHDVSVPPPQQLLSAERRRGLGQLLYSVLVDPIEPTLSGVDGLVVVPDGALSYLPFEALSDWDRTRLVERWRVRYTQSLRVLRLLRRRAPAASDSRGRRPLLAMGGIVYDSSGTAAGPPGVGEDGPAAADTGAAGRPLPDPVRGTVRGTGGRFEGERPVATYRRLGYGPERWQNIPGTLEETRALGRISERARLLVGAEASEHALHRMSGAGTLDDYRAVHFATHGFLVSDAPSLSALVLAEVGAGRTREQAPPSRADGPDGVTADGYLSMREIATLELDAEFVGLSACRTGLGRIYRGSGAVSLAQPFLRAGAQSVAVSLWSVYDASTSRFMEAVYRRAWHHETSWTEAIAETKRAFLEGDYGERLRAPRFWAPFVLYGWDAGGGAAGR